MGSKGLSIGPEGSGGSGSNPDARGRVEGDWGSRRGGVAGPGWAPRSPRSPSAGPSRPTDHPSQGHSAFQVRASFVWRSPR
eukprot:9486950-Pyramimonas_sp.AAC.1